MNTCADKHHDRSREHAYFADLFCLHACSCSIGLLLQITNSKVKLLRISGRWQQNIKPSTGTFWAGSSVQLHRSHGHEASPEWDCGFAHDLKVSVSWVCCTLSGTLSTVPWVLGGPVFHRGSEMGLGTMKATFLILALPSWANISPFRVFICLYVK